jgi:hypothetical protein
VPHVADDWSHEETDDPLHADRRKVEKWSRDGQRIEETGKAIVGDLIALDTECRVKPWTLGRVGTASAAETFRRGGSASDLDRGDAVDGAIQPSQAALPHSFCGRHTSCRRAGFILPT